MRRHLAALAVTVALMGAGLAGAASPALADPAGPTNYRSAVTAVTAADGSTPDVDVEVLGGDAFLVVRAGPGTRVDVPGYDGEPYLRIDTDGTVHVNELSPARWINDDRYGQVEPPAQVDAQAPPQWTLAGRGGQYAWHDHRIHYMASGLPEQVDAAAGTVQPIWEWTVPLVVDGRDVTVHGELAWLPGPVAAVPLGLVALAAAAAVWLVLRRPAAAGRLALAGALVTGAVGIVKLADLPPGAAGEPALVVLPAVSVGVLAVGTALGRRGVSRSGVLVAAAGIPLLVWGVLQAGALTRPVVPGPLPVGLSRALVALALAVGMAAVAAVGRAAVAASSTDQRSGDDGPAA